MNTPAAVDPDDGEHLQDCLADPGMLNENDAIRAMSIHHSCPPQCLVLGRALDTLSTEYTLIAGPNRQSSAAEPGHQLATQPVRSEEFSELDHRLAARLQELHRLQVRVEETK